jgi:hypothetical protein
MIKANSPIALGTGTVALAAAIFFSTSASALILTPEDPPPKPAASARAPGVAVTTKPVPLSSMPDLTSSKRLVINGGTTVLWGSVLSVDATQAKAASQGRCRFEFDSRLQNIGNQPSGAFIARWSDSRTGTVSSRQIPSIAPGGTQTPHDQVELTPGKHLLTLELDDTHQVTEANETNNTFKITLNVTGNCHQETSSERRANRFNPYSNAPLSAHPQGAIIPFTPPDRGWTKRTTTFDPIDPKDDDEH